MEYKKVKKYKRTGESQEIKISKEGKEELSSSLIESIELFIDSLFCYTFKYNFS
jgi:hypothetical protein